MLYLQTCKHKACFHYFSFLHQMIALKKLRKNLFILFIKHFLLSRYSSFCICFRRWSKINLKVYDIINCLNKNLITHFVWYLEKEKRYDLETLSIDRVLNKEHFYGKTVQRICTKSPLPDPFLILVNNPKHPLHARNSFRNKIFWKRIIKKPSKS